MATHADFLTDPLVVAAFTARGFCVETLPWHTSGLYPHPQVDLGIKGEAPSLHIDRERVMMRWFTPEQAVTYSIMIGGGVARRRVHVESTSMPETVVTAAEGRVLGEILDLPGAWEMDVLSAWNEADTGVTDGSVVIDVEPYVAAFAGDTEPAIMAWLARFGLSRRNLGHAGNLQFKGGSACLMPGGSYIIYGDERAWYGYEIHAKDGVIDEIVLTPGGMLPETVMDACIGMPLSRIVEIPLMGPRIVTGFQHLDLSHMVEIAIRKP